MVISIARAALRRRPFSVICALVLAIVFASLLRESVPVALLAWALGSALALELWLVLEPAVLERWGCRVPMPDEHLRLESALQGFPMVVRIVDEPAPWVGSGLRTIVVSRGALDLLLDRGLLGLLRQATIQQREAWLVRAGIVWLGNAPLLAAWCVSQCLGQLGRLLAIVIGSTLVLPMLLWPVGFVLWTGRVIGIVLVELTGAVLVSGGQAGPGLLLMLAWVLVPALRALLAWEWRRIEADADCATVGDGLGTYLLEALEMLASSEPVRPRGLLALLVPRGAALASRIKRVSKAIEPA